MASLSSNTRHDERHGRAGQGQLRRDGGRARGSRLAFDALPGARPEGKGDLAPRVEIRRRARQVQDEAADGADHGEAEFEQPIAQPQHLGSGTRGARRAQPQFLHERIAR